MVKYSLAALLLAAASSGHAADVLLRDAVSSGGTHNLDPANTYLEGVALDAGSNTTIDGNGALIDLVSSSENQITVGNNATLTIVNATIRHGFGIQVGTGGSLVLQDVVFENNTHTVRGNGHNNVSITNSQISNANNGVHLENAPDGSVQILNLHIFGSGVPSTEKQDGLSFNNIGNVSVVGSSVHEMAGGIVVVDSPSVFVATTSLLRNRDNQASFINVDEGLVEFSVLRGAPVGAHPGPSDFDAVYIQGSTVVIRESTILDSPENSIEAATSSLVVKRCFIAGARNSGIFGYELPVVMPPPEENVEEKSHDSQGSVVVVEDSTILNARLNGIVVDSNSHLTAARNIIGMTDDLTAFPSLGAGLQSDPFSGVGIQTAAPSFMTWNHLFYRPVISGLSVADLPEGDFETSRANFNTFQGDTHSSNGAIYNDALMDHEFTNNHVRDIPGGEGKQAVYVLGNSRIENMHQNWLDDTGTVGLRHDATGFTNADQNYWGASDGPSGLHSGSGSEVQGDLSTFDFLPFLTEAPMHSDVKVMNVTTSGTGSTRLSTHRVLVDVAFAGATATIPGTNDAQDYQAVVGLTEYHDATVVMGLPSPAANETRVHMNLWLDNRLPQHLQDPNNHVVELDFALVGDSTIRNSATLHWQTPEGVASKNADEIVRIGDTSRAIFRFHDRMNFPTAAVALSIFEGTSPTPPPTAGYASRWFLAEGATVPGFETFVLIANPNDESINVNIDFLTQSGNNTSIVLPVTARSRSTIKVNDFVPNDAVSVVLTEMDGKLFAVERAMYSTGPNFLWFGGHASVGVKEAANSWFMAEGASVLAGPANRAFETYILVANPDNTDVNVTLTFYVEGHDSFSLNEVIPANSRRTFIGNQTYDSRLDHVAFSTRVTAQAGRNIIVERSMWWNDENWTAESFMEGNASPGLKDLSQTWYLAEGNSEEWDDFLLIVNPNASPANITIRYLREGNSPVTRNFVVQGNQRKTIHVRFDPEGLGEGVRHGTVVTSDLAIAVERSMYRSEQGIGWVAGHNSTATPQAAFAWALPEGATVPIAVGNFRTEILLANPQDTAANVNLRFLLDNGTNVNITRTIPANQRITFVANDEAQLQNQAFSTVVTSDQAIVVERSMYWSSDTPTNLTITGGTSSMGIPLAHTLQQMANIDESGLPINPPEEPVDAPTPTATPTVTPLQPE